MTGRLCFTEILALLLAKKQCQFIVETGLYIASGNSRDIVDNKTDFQLNVENCESYSTSLHRCFWNPKSRVTGDYCSICLQTCLSENVSLNFYQFIIGVFLTAMGSILGFVFDSALISDVTPTKNQVYSLLSENFC